MIQIKRTIKCYWLDDDVFFEDNRDHIGFVTLVEYELYFWFVEKLWQFSWKNDENTTNVDFWDIEKMNFEINDS